MTPAQVGSLLGFLLCSLLSAQPGLAQSTEELRALRNELEVLKEGQKAIRKELEEIKNLLRARQAPPAEPQGVVLGVDDTPFKGDRTATLTLIEFSDYQCPFCARHFRETLPQLENEYISTGKVKYVFRDFPIESIHPQAFKAAEAANCAGRQGEYWKMHDRLFAEQNALGLQDLSQHARALGLDLATFQQCLEGGKEVAEIRKDIAEGQKAGVTGTPTFFFGRTEPNETKIKVLRVIRGAQPYAVFREVIESLLASEGSER